MIRGLFKLAARILGMVALVIVFTAIYLIYDGVTDKYGTADCIFVPGCSLKLDGEPGAELRQRLDRVVVLYHQKEARRVIVSGGDGSDRMEKAKAMSRYLREHEVPGDAILEDKIGTDASGAYSYAAGLMKLHDIQSVLLVTHYYNVTLSKVELAYADVKPVLQVHAGAVSGKDAIDFVTQFYCLGKTLSEHYFGPDREKNLATLQTQLQQLKDKVQKDAAPIMDSNGVSDLENLVGHRVSNIDIMGVCSYQIPTGWTAKALPGLENPVAVGPDEKPSSPAIEIDALEIKDTADQIAEKATRSPGLYSAALKKKANTNPKVLGTRPFATTSGLNGVRAEATVDTGGGMKRMVIYVFEDHMGPFVVKSERIVLVCRCAEENAAACVPLFDKSAATLYLLSP